MQELKQEVIETKSLSTITCDIIRREIIEGKLQLGTNITELDVSDRLGVSRVVVREAFLTLEKEGLLIKERNKRTKIIEFTKKDVKEIFDLRIALEIAAALECIENDQIPFDELIAEYQTSDKITKSTEVDPLTFSEIIRKGFDLHRKIVVYSGNKRILDVFDSLYNQILILMYKHKYDELKASGYFEHTHTDIIDALKSKDANRIQVVLRNHIKKTEDFLLSRY